MVDGKDTKISRIIINKKFVENVFSAVVIDSKKQFRSLTK